MTATSTALSTKNRYQELFSRQKLHAGTVAKSTASERIKKIKLIRDWTYENEDRIFKALKADFKRGESETKISEIIPVTGEARYIIKHLKSWMRPESIDVPLRLLGTTGKVTHEPKGNCLIISPWNYPFNLTLKPLLQAIAAGNVCIIKPSEMTPHTSLLLKEMLTELFDENEICVIEGDAETAIELQKLPFNHTFFTGSPAVGKLVMAAAAKNLTSVTLELGGKCPAIIDKKVDLNDAALKIIFGKFMNNGQTCIAPDYLLVHSSIKEKFTKKLVEKLTEMYGNDIENNPDYARIVNAHHLNRLKDWLQDAESKGGKVLAGGKSNDSDNYFAPTIISEVTEEMTIMQQEIFGPILPIKFYDDLPEALDYINANDKPLALYLFSRSSETKKTVAENTSSGAFVINDVVIHYLIESSPFGGVNNSGIGKSFGHYGFVEFSNIKPVVENKFSQTSLFAPPYIPTIKLLLNAVAKWL
ncbi:MAG: aldehyde dehydrogenase (NAD+) [Spirosomataceae bacterium]|jgi:aldehyde dehydrogenase (NAD+)